MSAQPLVSVIVPVYNVEDYLAECVESILTQTHTNLELILIDDGSSDGSGPICDNYAEADSRVVVRHFPNQGPGCARNMGLRLAHGEWVCFVDSDDVASPVYIETLLSAALSVDCAMARVPLGEEFCDADRLELARSADEVPDSQAVDRNCALLMLLYQKIDTALHWGIYRRDLIPSDPFPDIVVGEDMVAVAQMVAQTESVAIIPSTHLYGYRVRRSGIIRQPYRAEKGVSAIKASRLLGEAIPSEDRSIERAYASRAFSVLRTVFAQSPISDKDSRTLFDEASRFRRVVIGDSNARSRERLAAAVACLGRLPFALFCKACRLVGLMR